MRSILRDILSHSESLQGLQAYCQNAPDNAARPYIIYTVTGTDPLETAGKSESWCPATVEIATLSDSPDNAEAVAANVKAALCDYSDAKISDIALTNEYDTPSTDPAGSIYGITQLFTITYR